MKDAKKAMAGYIGGLKASSIVRKCPHCGVEIGGPVYFYHLKKCKVAHINNQKATEQNEPLND